MTLKKWKKILLPSEIEALTDYYQDENENLTPNEVMDTIIKWNGGISTGYEVRSMISRIYDIKL